MPTNNASILSPPRDGRTLASLSQSSVCPSHSRLGIYEHPSLAPLWVMLIVRGWLHPGRTMGALLSCKGQPRAEQTSGGIAGWGGRTDPLSDLTLPTETRSAPCTLWHALSCSS